MKLALIMTAVALISTNALAKDANKDLSKNVVALLVRNSATIKLVDTNGKNLARAQQLPALLAEMLTTGFEDAAVKGATIINLSQTNVDCKTVTPDQQTCEVTLLGTNFETANDGYQLTKLDDASGGWSLNVELVKKNGKWILGNQKIQAVYAE